MNISIHPGTIKPRRFDIYMADLFDLGGSVQNGVRPVLIVQNNIGNYYSPTTIVVPITSSEKSSMPTHVDIDTDCGLWKQSTVLCEQITTIPSDALLERLGSVRNQEDIDKINLALKISLGIREVEP